MVRDCDCGDDDDDATENTYFTPINEYGVGRKCDPNKSVEGNCERIHTLNLQLKILITKSIQEKKGH